MLHGPPKFANVGLDRRIHVAEMTSVHVTVTTERIVHTVSNTCSSRGLGALGGNRFWGTVNRTLPKQPLWLTNHLHAAKRKEVIKVDSNPYSVL